MTHDKKPSPIPAIVLIAIGLALVILGARMSSGGPVDSDESNPWGNIDGFGGAVLIGIGCIPGAIGLWQLARRSRWG